MEEYRNSKGRSARHADTGRDAIALLDTDLSKAPLNPQLLSDLTDVVLSQRQSNDSTVLDLAASASVSLEDMADHYIPAVARTLGDRWCSDHLAFAEVTIGTARLQAMLRELGENWAADHSMNPDASTVLLAVLDDVYHTLGAFVLSGQLRRKGLSVRLLLGATVQSISESCEMTQYDAVFISSNIGDKLESLRKAVGSVKRARNIAPPVVIGGSLLETTSDVIALTGADYIASSAEEAIALCNLRTKPRVNIAVDR